MEQAGHTAHSARTEQRENQLFAFAIASSLRSSSASAVDAASQQLPPELPALALAPLAVLLLAAVSCNCFLIVAMQRLGNNRLAPCLYITVICSTEVALLTSRAGDLWLRAASGVSGINSVLTQFPTACSVYPFAYGFALHTRAFAHVGLGWDTFCLYWQPARAWQRLKPERVRNTIIAICAATLLVNSQHLWSYSLEHVNVLNGDVIGNLCTISSIWLSQWWRDRAWPMLDFLLSSPLPAAATSACLLLCCGCVLLRTASGQYQRLLLREEGFQDAGHSGLTLRPDSELTVLGLSVKYIIDYPTFVELRRCFLLASAMFVAASLGECALFADDFQRYASASERFAFSRQNVAGAAPDFAPWQPHGNWRLRAAACCCTFACMSLKLLAFAVCSAAVRRQVAALISSA